MGLSRDPAIRKRQMAVLSGGNKKIEGLLKMELEDPRKIKLNIGRTLATDDRHLLDEGEVVLNNIELVEPPQNYSVKTFFENLPDYTQENLARTFGRDKKVVNELLQNRLEHKKGWVYALPLIYENETGKKITEDRFNFTWYAMRDRVKIVKIDPKKLVKISGINEKESNKSTTIKTRNNIRSGKPIETPRIELDSEGKIESLHGVDRARGAMTMNIKEIPLYIVTVKPIDMMSRLEKQQLESVDFKKVN